MAAAADGVGKDGIGTDEAGSVEGGPVGEGACLNCGAPLTGPYCSDCGQKHEREIPTVGRLVGDLFADLFAFDSRIWRTIRLLVARPGALTAEYLAGRRTRYLPPLRLFMTTGIVMLLVYSLSGDSLVRIGTDADGAGGSSGEASDAEAVDGGGAGEPSEVAEAGPSEPDLGERIGRAVRTRVSQDPEGIAEAFGDNLPRMMLLLLPLAAAMLMLLYLGSGRRYVEHLVFSLHAHAFVFLGLSAARTLRAWVVGEDSLAGAIVVQGVLVWTLIYFFLALRRVYGQKWLATSVKFVVLVGAYGVLLTVMLALTALASVFLQL